MSKLMPICVVIAAATAVFAPCAAVPSACPSKGSCELAPASCVPARKPEDTSRPYCFTPRHISRQAQAHLSNSYAAMLRMPSADDMLSNASAVQQMRQEFDDLTEDVSAIATRQFFASIKNSTIASVPVVLAIPKTYRHPSQAGDDGEAKSTCKTVSLHPESVLNRNSAAANTCAVRRSSKLLVYFHGGGYVMGSCYTNGLLTVSMVAHFSRLPVLCVEYRLAPEAPFPAALDDALVVYKALMRQYGYHPKSLAVLGDSAGGGLTMALLQQISNKELPMPGAVGLFSPWLELSGEIGDSLTTLTAVDPKLQYEVNGYSAAMAYVAGNRSMLKDPLVSPLHGNYSSAIFPPILIQVGLRDSLLSTCAMLYRRLREGGQAGVVFSPWEAMWHVFEAFVDVPEAHAANQEMAAFFVEHVGGGALTGSSA